MQNQTRLDVFLDVVTDNTRLPNKSNAHVLICTGVGVSTFSFVHQHKSCL